MPSNEMIEQLQRLLETDATIPQNVTNGLLLAALRTVYQEVKDVKFDLVKVQELIGVVENFDEDAKERSETLKSLDQSIRGNGKPGLNERISLIEDWVGGQIWFQRLLVGVIIAELIGLIWHYIAP